MARRASFVALAFALAAASAGAGGPMRSAMPQPEIRSTSFVTSDGVRLNVLEACPRTAASRSPALVFIPGWSMPAGIWRAQLLALGSERCVAALDPRGQGASEVPAAGYTTARRAEDIRELVGRYSRVVLIGWSLGALEALEYVHRHGDAALEGLVLVDTSVGEDPRPAPAGDFRAALKSDRRAALEAFVRESFRTPRAAEEIEALVEAALRMPLEASLSLFPRSTPREHWRGIVRSFQKPLLYVVTPQFAGQAQALGKRRPGTRVAVFERAGHALFADEPDAFNELLSRFVAEVLGDGPMPLAR